MNHRTPVAWDIETTGFGATERITVSGFWFPAGHAELVLNTGDSSEDQDARPAHRGRDSPPDLDLLERRLEELSGVPVVVRAVETEQALLAGVQECLFERFDREQNCLVAFNAESWKNGFDLPFVRTRCIAHDHEWIFDGLRFADLWDPINKRLNTTWTAHGTQTAVNSLTGVYDLIVEQVPVGDVRADTADGGRSVGGATYASTAYDPFDDSGEAVAAYNEGDYGSVCQHNLADIHRTQELAVLVDEYVASSDISMKKL